MEKKVPHKPSFRSAPTAASLTLDKSSIFSRNI